MFYAYGPSLLNKLFLSFMVWFDLLYLTPLSAIFHLYHDDQFYKWKKPSSRREPPTMGKQLVNYITCDCERSAPFFSNLQTQALVSFKTYMLPPLLYFKVNICPLPLPHFASIFFTYLWSFRWPNYIVTLPRYFSFRLPHLNIPTGPPQTNWTRIFSERRIFYFEVIETGTVTSGPF
jgi:hypothetical protein